MKSIQVAPGQPLPTGATVTETGTNFAIFSRNATRVWLMLFDQATDGTPSHEFELDPATNRTGDTWHIHLSGVGHGQLYLYRLDGPYLPQEGHRFNRFKPLLDPYAKTITGDFEWDFSQAFGYDPASPQADLSFSTTTHLAGMPKGIVYGDDGFDWQGDRPLGRPFSETIIYETHVRSLTCHPSGAEVELEPTIAYHVKARSIVVLVAAWGPKTTWSEKVGARRDQATKRVMGRGVGPRDHAALIG